LGEGLLFAGSGREFISPAIRFQGFDITDIGLTGHALAANGHFDLTAVVEVSLVFVAVKHGKSSLVHTAEQ
jgi:hypothetical protein